MCIDISPDHLSELFQETREGGMWSFLRKTAQKLHGRGKPTIFIRLRHGLAMIFLCRI
jgi:hypothetical protein